MTPEPEKNSQLPPEFAEPIKFRLPQQQEVEVFLLQDETGQFRARTREELSKLPNERAR